MGRLALLYDGRSLAWWQARVVQDILREHELFTLIAEGGHAPRRNLARHALYYLLNLFTIRRAQARKPFPHSCSEADTCFHFRPIEEGAWVRLPAEAMEWLERNQIEAVIKFGLGLLRIEDRGPPILSWHHGDPARFRGRPAGFYETVQGEAFVGQVVQRLTNRLDAGEVLAFAETRVHPHSYTRTLTDAYALSPHLLRRALGRLRNGERVDRRVDGENYRLPSNMQVIAFVLHGIAALIRRLLYGALYEKRWRCSTVRVPDTAGHDMLVGHLESERGRWRNYQPPAGFNFVADPFFCGRPDDLLVEACAANNGKGKIMRLIDGSPQVLRTEESFHLSYPSTFVEGAKTYVVPEMARGGRQTLFTIDGDRLVKEHELIIDAGPLLDPTLFRHEGRVYLFASRRADGSSLLRLWSAASLFERFEEHPSSPIRISARGSRMAGAIRRTDDGIFRFGQDCRRAYGDGILIFRIEELNATRYSESRAGTGCFREMRGPHTLNLLDDTATFDWYEDRFSALAGVRRLRAML